MKGLAEVSTSSEGQPPPVPQGPPLQPPPQQAPPPPPPPPPPQQHPQFAQHPPGSAVPQSIPLSMVAPAIADSPELQKQVSPAPLPPPPATERDGTRWDALFVGTGTPESGPIGLRTWTWTGPAARVAR